MQPQPEARLRPSWVENLRFNLITFRLTENTLAATLEWSAKALYCTFVSRSTDSAEAGGRSLNAIGYWIMETGVAPTMHNSVYTFSWSMKLKDSWWGWGLFHLWESSKLIAPNQLFDWMTTSPRRCWLLLDKDGWCVPVSVVKALSLYRGRPRRQSLSKLVLMFQLEDSETRARAEEDAAMIKRMI